MTIDKNCQVKLFGTTQPSINAIRTSFHDVLYQEKEGKGMYGRLVSN